MMAFKKKSPDRLSPLTEKKKEAFLLYSFCPLALPFASRFRAVARRNLSKKDSQVKWIHWTLICISTLFLMIR